MGKPTGFLEFERHDRAYEPIKERISHCNEFMIPLKKDDLKTQAARCMDCGIPFCHQGCPVMNIIPEWNDLTYRDNMKAALKVLHSTNNFPEFTGRVCPAPCETACTLNLQDNPVTIKTIECALVDKGWSKGWIKPHIPRTHTDKVVAVVGAGPAGMACAQQLARVGHKVELFEKNAYAGGLLRYGIPDFKLTKSIIDRRLSQMQTEGVYFRPNTQIGVDISAKTLLRNYDAIVLTGGAEKPRDLDVPGRTLKGVHFAMDFLTQQNRRVGGEDFAEEDILAEGKDILVIGGGDTGADCVGTSTRQGAHSITQIEIMTKPPAHEDKLTTWPDWPYKLRSSTSHEEGCVREWDVSIKGFVGDENGNLKAAECVRVQWTRDANQWVMSKVDGSDFEIPCQRAFLAMGFVHPIHEGMIDELGLDKDSRGNVFANTDDYQTSTPKVFAAGDIRRGQSLVVWAIREGRQAARAVDAFLMGATDLPR